MITMAVEEYRDDYLNSARSFDGPFKSIGTAIGAAKRRVKRLTPNDEVRLYTGRLHDAGVSNYVGKAAYGSDGVTVTFFHYINR